MRRGGSYEGMKEIERERERQIERKRRKKQSFSSESGRVEAVLFSVQPFCAPPLTSLVHQPFSCLLHRHRFHQLAINFNLKLPAKPLAPLARRARAPFAPLRRARLARSFQPLSFNPRDSYPCTRDRDLTGTLHSLPRNLTEANLTRHD